MLPQRNVVNVVNVVDHKSSRQRQRRSGGAAASSSGGGSGGRRTMIKITRNPFFNFRTLVRHRVCAAAPAAAPRHNAVAISTMAGREWSALDEQQKRPYRRLAHLSKMNGGPFFVRLEHLRTFLRYPECVHHNEYFARIHGRSTRQPEDEPCRDAGAASKAAVRPEGVSPQPDANFGGYEVASKSTN